MSSVAAGGLVLRMSTGDAWGNTVVVVVDAVTLREGLDALHARVGDLLARDGVQVAFDVGALVDPDRGTVDALARLQLTARRAGRCIRLHNTGDALRGMLALAGLEDELGA